MTNLVRIIFASTFCMSNLTLGACHGSTSSGGGSVVNANPLVGNKYDGNGCSFSTGFGPDFMSVIVGDEARSATHVSYSVVDKPYENVVNQEVTVTSAAGDKQVYLSMLHTIQMEYLVVAGVKVKAPPYTLMGECPGEVSAPASDRYVQGSASNSLGQAMFWAISFSDESAVNELLNKGVKADMPMSSAGAVSSETPLELAQAQGKQGIFESLMESLSPADNLPDSSSPSD